MIIWRYIKKIDKAVYDKGYKIGQRFGYWLTGLPEEYR